MSDRTQTISVELTRLELAGTLAAVRAVMDSAPGGPPPPLVRSADKLNTALKEANHV